MSEGFLDKPAVLSLYLRKYKHGELDDRWKEYIGNSTAIKLRSKGVHWSTSVSVTEDGSLKLSLAVGFRTIAGNLKYRVLDEVQIVGITQNETTTFISVVNTILRQLAILVVQFEDVNLWDAGFFMEKAKELPSRWCNAVTDIVSPVPANNVLPRSPEYMLQSLNLLADALFREFRVGEDDATAAMTKEPSDGTLQISKRRAREKEKCGEGGVVEKSTVRLELEAGGAVQTVTRRDAPRTAVVVEPSPAETRTQGKTKGKKVTSSRSGGWAEEDPKFSFEASIPLRTPTMITSEAERVKSRVVLGVPAPKLCTSPPTASLAAATEATSMPAASARKSTDTVGRDEVHTTVAPAHSSGRIPGMKLKTKKRKGARKTENTHPHRMDASADGEGAMGNEYGKDGRPSGIQMPAVPGSEAGASSPMAPSSRAASPAADREPYGEPSSTRQTPIRLTSRRLPMVRRRYDGTWTSYPPAQTYDVAKERAQISSAVYKQPPSKGDRDEKSYKDLRIAHNMEFKKKVEYMYLFGYDQHFQLPVERMRPVNQETEGLMVYRKLEKDSINIVYDKMSSLHYQKQVFTVMPDTRRRPASWGEICDDVEFIIINGQHTWAAAKEVLGRTTIPDPELVDMMRLWECKVVWTTNHDHLHSLSYLCNDSNSGDAICSSTASAIMHCRALWEDAGKPVQVRKNAARGGAQDADAAVRKKWEAFKDKAMQALIATLNPSVRRKFFDFDSRGERYLVMTSDEVWKKWETIFKLHRLGDVKDVVTGKPVRLAKDWEYKPVGSSVREVSGLTDGEIGELATRILESPAKVYLQPPPKDSKKRVKVHRAQSVKEWCMRKKQKKLVLREVQRRVNQVRGDHSYFPLNFNLYDMDSNVVQYGDWEFVKQKHGLTSHHMEYLLRSTGSSFFVEQNKRPSFIIQRSHLFTKAIDQVLLTRSRALHLESVPGFAIEYLHGEKTYSKKLMEYNRITHRRISADPSYKRSTVAISDITVGCIILDTRNFPHHPNEQIDSLTERTFLAGLEAMGDADMTSLQALLCITLKHRTDILKRMLERYFDSDVQFQVFQYEPVGGEQRPLTKAAEHQTSVLVMTTAAGRAAGDSEVDTFQVNKVHQGVEPSDYKQTHYRIEHRHCEFVGELRMELYLRYIDRFCDEDQAVLLMHSGTKAIRASRMLGRVCISLHDLQTSTRQVIFAKAFMEGLTMIPRAFFYSSPSPLKTKLPKFHLQTASGDKVAVGWDPPSESESSASQGSVETTVQTSPEVSVEVNTGDHTEEVLQEMVFVREGSGDEGSESEELRSEGTAANTSTETSRDEEGGEDSEVGGNNSAGCAGQNEDDEGAESEASEDAVEEVETYMVDSDSTDSENSTPELVPEIRCSGAAVVVPVEGVVPHDPLVEHSGILRGEEAPVEPVRGDSPAIVHPVRGGNAVPGLPAHCVGVAPERGLVPPLASTDCVPATPEPPITRLDGDADDAYLFDLLVQGSPAETTVSMDVIMRQLAEQRRATEEQRRANNELQQQNAALARRLAARGDSSVIDLDEVDDNAMEESMEDLAAVAQELKGSGFQVKEEFAHPLLPVSTSSPVATPPAQAGCSKVVGSGSSGDVKPAVGDIWRRMMAEGTALRKRKREVDILVTKHNDMLEILADTNRRHNEVLNKLEDKDKEIAELRKLAPSAGAINSFRATQQSQLFSANSSGASPMELGGKSTASPSHVQGTPEAAHANQVDTVPAGERFPSRESGLELSVDLTSRGVSVVAPDEDGQPPSAEPCSAQ